MKKINNIINTFSLSCLMVSALFMVALNVQANDLGGNFDNNDDKVVKKTETKYNLTAMPKTNLSLDAGFTASGILRTDFKLSSDNTVNVRSVVTYKRGNVTYIVPYIVQVPPMQNSALDQHYQQLRMQVKLPFRKN